MFEYAAGQPLDAAQIMIAEDPMEEKRARLAEIIHTYSYDDAEITLSSGETSGYYFNLKPTMLDPEGAMLLSDLMLERILDAGAGFFGGLELGAVPIIGAIARHSHTYQPPLQGLIVRKQPKGHGTQALIEGLRPGQDLTGERVAVVEDVATTGSSILQAIGAFRAAGAEVVLALPVIDREAGAAELCRQAGVPFASIFTASELRDAA